MKLIVLLPALFALTLSAEPAATNAAAAAEPAAKAAPTTTQTQRDYYAAWAEHVRISRALMNLEAAEAHGQARALASDSHDAMGMAMGERYGFPAKATTTDAKQAKLTADAKRKIVPAWRQTRSRIGVLEFDHPELKAERDKIKLAYFGAQLPTYEAMDARLWGRK